MEAREMFMAIFSTLSNLVSKEIFSAFLGAIIGGYFTSRATTKAHELNNDRQTEQEKTITNNTLRLIQVELNTAWELYNEEYVDTLLALPPGTPHLYTFPIGDNPFPIYDSSPPHLANVPSAISGKIVRIYMRTKGLIKMINENNRDCEIVFEYARNKWKEAFESVTASGRPVPKEIQDIVDHIFDKESQNMSRQMGMGASAEGLKDLTRELRDSILTISKDIDSYLKENL
ncbi:hypothetical protein [Pseudomonas sp. NPDC086251]|uniref:hypothetical protein n=1 Tax=Pseudomonas sp. NPDC086251 TaxID=3364431 RepID=UPI0038395DB9